MQVTGYYDTDGRGPFPFKLPIPVSQLGNRLIDCDGTCWAVKDDYSDWVSPTLHQIGVKAKQHVEQ